MDKSGTLARLASLASEALSDNLLDFGIANSFFNHQSPGDIDTLLLVDKIDPTALSAFITEANKASTIKVSARSFTPLMYDSRCLEPKIAVMLYKGVTFNSTKNYPVTLPELQAIVRPLIPTAIAEISSAVSSGKLSYPKAYDLLVQFLVLCHKNEPIC